MFSFQSRLLGVHFIIILADARTFYVVVRSLTYKQTRQLAMELQRRAPTRHRRKKKNQRVDDPRDAPPDLAGPGARTKTQRNRKRASSFRWNSRTRSIADVEDSYTKSRKKKKEKNANQKEEKETHRQRPQRQRAVVLEPKEAYERPVIF
jgi:hypothetical protein